MAKARCDLKEKSRGITGCDHGNEKDVIYPDAPRVVDLCKVLKEEAATLFPRGITAPSTM
jgi:hypothetical protein